MPLQSNASVQSAAVIDVCLPASDVKAIEKAMMSMGWHLTPAHFDAYISAERRPSISPEMKASSLKIAFVDFDADAEAAAESTRHLKQIFRNAVIVIAVGKPRDADLLLMAMRCGCNEFLQKPVSHEILIETLGRLSASMDPPEQDRERGSILSLSGVKGGVGTTTIAVHLAMYLVQCHGKKTLLIDNHAELGHVCVYLGLDGSHFHFQEVLSNVSRLDSELLRGYVARHESGLEVLSSPETSGNNARNADPQAMKQTLEFLRGEYDFIIVDSDIGLDEDNLSIIQAAAQAYLIATPEIASLRDLSRYLDAFKYIDGVQEKLRVVLNRYNSSSAVSLEQIESAIGQHVSLRLSNNHPDLQRVENLGHTLAPTAKVEFATQMVRWASGLGGVSVLKNVKQKHKKPHLFGWMHADEVAH